MFLKRFLFLLYLCAGSILAEDFDKQELTQGCMYMLDNFGVADTFFTSRICKDIIAEREDERHYGDSLYRIAQYDKCIAKMVEFNVKDTAYYQKLCKDFVIESMTNRDSVDKENRTKIIDVCVKQRMSPDGRDSSRIRNVCNRAANKLLRRQKARPHRQAAERPIVLATDSSKEKMTQECMYILDNFGIADTFFISKTCKSITVEIEDELHYGDSLFSINQYTQCATYLMDNNGITDTVKIQKICQKTAEKMVKNRDSDEKEYKEKLMDRCLMLKSSFGASEDSAHYRRICERSTNKSLRHQKARPHRQ